ncbi:MAG: response regulator [Azospirillum sp.]|nr:response regulator [Azospirillum sp.]
MCAAPAPLPPDERARLAALRRYRILDTAPEDRFDRLTRLAAHLFQAPIALISLLDDRRQWFKSRVGLAVTETPRDLAFSAHTILSEDVMVVSDASVDPRFSDNPLVLSTPQIRFYAGAPLRTADGFAVGSLCVIDRHRRPDLDATLRALLHDLAGMVVNELELRQSLSVVECTMASLAEAQRIAGIGKWDWDLANEAMSWSDEGSRICGLPPRQAIAFGTFLDKVHPEDRERVTAAFRQAADQRGPISLEHRVVGADGAVRVVAGRGESVEDASGVRLTGTVTDITERHHIEGELRAAKDAAERASSSKSAFLAMISHELRTPMNGLLGTLSLLGETELRPEQRRLLDTARTSGEALLTILNEILDLAKMEAGRIDLEPVTFDPATLLSSIVELCRPEARRKTLRMVAEVDPAVPARVVADDGRIRQMLVNLLSNALKFTAQGMVSIRLAGQLQAPDRFQLEAVVSDSGIGIPTERHKDVFTEFAQLAPSDRRRAGGTGLGLAITRRLAEAMGGTVGFSSEEGIGSRFWFSIPVIPSVGRPAPAPPDPQARNGAPATAAPAASRRIDVLIAEDNATNQLVLKLMLEKLGCRVDLANNGLEALDAVARRPYHLVLMDISMPDLDGLDATRLIRAMGGPLACTPIVAVTASAMRDDQIRCLDAGMDGCLTKPVRRDQLLKVLERAFALAELDPAKPTDQDAAPLLDSAVLAELGSDVGDMLPELVNTFRSEIGSKLANLTGLLDKGDLRAAVRVCHSLSGAAGQVGAIRLDRIAGQAELAFKAGDTMLARRIIATIPMLGVDTLAALETVIVERGWSQRERASPS